MAVHYTEVAEQALVAIQEYTWREWGPAQCERYMGLLEVACERWVPEHASLARVVPERPDLRMLRCERHMIYFRQLGADFEIVHVLHDRSLPRRHL